MMYLRHPHTLLHTFFMEKELKSKCSKIFTEPKTPKGGLMGLKRNEAMKEEDMGLHNSVPETRTNLWSFARKFIKIK